MPLGPCPAVSMDVPPYGVSGTLYGALLNHQSALQALGDVINQPPYQAAPKGPVLYIKPRNTLAVGGEPVAVPPGVAELEIGATLGLVIGRPACRLSEERALEHLAGYLIVNDVSIPHQPYRSEEHTSELQSRSDLVCRLLLEKKKKDKLNA